MTQLKRDQDFSVEALRRAFPKFTMEVVVTHADEDEMTVGIDYHFRIFIHDLPFPLYEPETRIYSGPARELFQKTLRLLGLLNIRCWLSFEDCTADQEREPKLTRDTKFVHEALERAFPEIHFEFELKRAASPNVEYGTIVNINRVPFDIFQPGGVLMTTEAARLTHKIKDIIQLFIRSLVAVGYDPDLQREHHERVKNQIRPANDQLHS